MTFIKSIFLIFENEGIGIYVYVNIKQPRLKTKFSFPNPLAKGHTEEFNNNNIQMHYMADTKQTNKQTCLNI